MTVGAVTGALLGPADCGDKMGIISQTNSLRDGMHSG